MESDDRIEEFTSPLSSPYSYISSEPLTNDAGAIWQCKGLNGVHSTDDLFRRHRITPMLPFSTTMADTTECRTCLILVGLTFLHTTSS